MDGFNELTLDPGAGMKRLRNEPGDKSREELHAAHYNNRARCAALGLGQGEDAHAKAMNYARQAVAAGYSNEKGRPPSSRKTGTSPPPPRRTLQKFTALLASSGTASHRPGGGLGGVLRALLHRFCTIHTDFSLDGRGRDLQARRRPTEAHNNNHAATQSKAEGQGSRPAAAALTNQNDVMMTRGTRLFSVQ